MAFAVQALTDGEVSSPLGSAIRSSTSQDAKALSDGVTKAVACPGKALLSPFGITPIAQRQDLMIKQGDVLGDKAGP